MVCLFANPLVSRLIPPCLISFPRFHDRRGTPHLTNPSAQPNAALCAATPTFVSRSSNPSNRSLFLRCCPPLVMRDAALRSRSARRTDEASRSQVDKRRRTPRLYVFRVFAPV